jgi:uncharacterized protein (DUF305 family)
MVALPQDQTATVEHLLREELSRESAPAVRASRPRSAAPRSSPAANFYRRSSISCGQIRSHVSTAAGLKTRASRAAESLQRMVAHLLPHHRAAIEMARAELLHGRDPSLRRLAQEIIIDQQAEIEVTLTPPGRPK